MRPGKHVPVPADQTMAAEGLTTIRSRSGPTEAMNRLEAAVKATCGSRTPR
jgi:hypothetical protein